MPVLSDRNHYNVQIVHHGCGRRLIDHHQMKFYGSTPHHTQSPHQEVGISSDISLLVHTYVNFSLLFTFHLFYFHSEVAHL